MKNDMEKGKSKDGGREFLKNIGLKSGKTLLDFDCRYPTEFEKIRAGNALEK